MKASQPMLCDLRLAAIQIDAIETLIFRFFILFCNKQRHLFVYNFTNHSVSVHFLPTTLMATPMSPKQSRSAIWKHFTTKGDLSKAKCITCGSELSRGTNLKKLTNGAMINHVKSKHPELWSSIEETKKDEESRKRKMEEMSEQLQPSKKMRMLATFKQETIESTIERGRMWDLNSDQSKAALDKIGKLIDIHNIIYLYIYYYTLLYAYTEQNCYGTYASSLV